MKHAPHVVPPAVPATAKGFSLVEVVLALGICAFAMVAIVGMIPVGLSTFRDAMDMTVQSQIVQRTAGDVLVSDFWRLGKQSEYQYFDDQGTLLSDLEGPSHPHLAYTAKIERVAIKVPAGGASVQIPNTTGEMILVKVARTHPHQDFEHVAAQFPKQVLSYPVAVTSAQSEAANAANGGAP